MTAFPPPHPPDLSPGNAKSKNCQATLPVFLRVIAVPIIVSPVQVKTNEHLLYSALPVVLLMTRVNNFHGKCVSILSKHPSNFDLDGHTSFFFFN